MLGSIAPLRVEALIDQTEVKPVDAWYDLEPAPVSRLPTHTHTNKQPYTGTKLSDVRSVNFPSRVSFAACQGWSLGGVLICKAEFEIAY